METPGEELSGQESLRGAAGGRQRTASEGTSNSWHRQAALHWHFTAGTGSPALPSPATTKEAQGLPPAFQPHSPPPRERRRRISLQSRASGEEECTAPWPDASCLLQRSSCRARGKRLAARGLVPDREREEVSQKAPSQPGRLWDCSSCALPVCVELVWLWTLALALVACLYMTPGFSLLCS